MTSLRQATWRDTWWPDRLAGALTLVVGALSPHQSLTDSSMLITLLVGGAVVLARRYPPVGLMIAWVLVAVHLLALLGPQPVELALAWAAFACGRWGLRTTRVAAGVSLALLPVFALMAIGLFGYYGFMVNRSGDTLGYAAPVLAILLTFAVAYVAGLALRSQDTVRRSHESQVAAQAETKQAQTEAEQAREIARLREQQAQLGRDVHDVVGHSLAVILAQAESAQYLPDDADQLKTTLATIATSARTSLQDVRRVLSPTPGGQTPGGLAGLVEGVRASGREVVVDEVGEPQPLPPELEVVAHRVLQEMLTNAVRHGLRSHPVRVERHWPGSGLERDLRIEVSNVELVPEPGPAATAAASVAATQEIPSHETPGHETPAAETPPSGTTLAETTTVPPPDRTPGQGLEGMRRRVDSVGGRLDVRRRVGPDGPTFTVTAYVPVRRVVT